MHKGKVVHVYFFYNRQISDAGLVHLNGLPNLQGLRLSRTRVTGDGIAELQQGYPAPPATDAAPLANPISTT